LSLNTDGNHKFTKAENDRGFARLIALEELLNEERGFVVGDKLEIHTFVSIRRVEMSRMMEPRISYDSKKETGFVGLKNQGATCYMNSLLQFFFHIPRLREAVYNMPTEDAKEGLPLALQRVFYHLQTNLKSVDTKALTKSFGWGSMDSFMQHDVQEFSRLLCDKLEEKMKNTKVDGMIAELFQGKLENFIECINVNYESTRMENFYDLSLMVKGCPTLYDSFKQVLSIYSLFQNK
jgi:ubiquitin carboxyl-terminal hydrolase 7